MAKLKERANKTQQVGEVLAELLSNKFTQLAEEVQDNLWISRKDKKTGEFGKNMNVDMDKLQKVFNDEEYFNLWQSVEDLTKKEINEQAKSIAEYFYQSPFYLGLKFPYTSEDEKSVSYAILKYDN